MAAFKILLTGATGFIGTRLLPFLKAKGARDIVVLGRRPLPDPDVETIVLTDFTAPALDAALAGASFDAVIHLLAAGVNPAQRDGRILAAINGALPFQLVDIAIKRGAKAVVIAGSNSEYAFSGERRKLTETSPLETAKLYGATKAAGGLQALAHGATHQMPVGVLRIFNTYGPGEPPHRLLPMLVKGLSVQARVPLSAGTQIRDFIHVDDVCAGLWAALEKLAARDMPTGAYNLATGHECSVADFARTVARRMGVDEQWLDFGALPMRPDDVPYLVGDPALFKKSCGWYPTLTVENGIADALKGQGAGDL